MKSDYECSDKPESLRFVALFIVQRIAICKTSWPNDTQDEGDARSIPEFRLLRERMPMNMLRQAFTCIHFSLGMSWFLSSLDQEPFKITFRNNFELPSLKLTVHTKFPLKMDGCAFMYVHFLSGFGLWNRVRTGNCSFQGGAQWSSIPALGASVSSVPTVRLGTSHAKPPWYKALARQDCWTTKNWSKKHSKIY